MVQNEFRAVKQRPEDVAQGLFASRVVGVARKRRVPRAAVCARARPGTAPRSPLHRPVAFDDRRHGRALAELVASSMNLPFIIISACWMDARISTG